MSKSGTTHHRRLTQSNQRTHSHTRALLPNTWSDGFVRPGESVHVNLVCVDETHVFKHAEDALQTHTTASVTFCSFSLPSSNPPQSRSFSFVSYQRRGVVRQGAGRVCEFGKAGVDLLHGFDPRYQQLRHLFLWHLQHTHTESYWVNNMDSVSKYNASEWESEWDVQMWCHLHMVHHHLIGQVGPELSFMDSLVEQRLEKQTSCHSNLTRFIQFTYNPLLYYVQFTYSPSKTAVSLCFIYGVRSLAAIRA